MAPIITSLLFLGILAGQLIQLHIIGLDIALLDIALLLSLCLGLAANHGSSFKKLWQNPVAKGGLILCLILLISWIWAAPAILPDTSAWLVSGLYCFRLIGYLLLVPILINLLRPKHIPIIHGQILILGGLIATIGFFQLAVFPNFSIFNQFGWDPHQGRLLATFLDPNYTSVFLVQILVLALAQITWGYLPRPATIWVSVVSLFAILATLSRTGFITLASGLATFFSLISARVTILAATSLLLLVLILPATNHRIMAAINLDVTTRFRLESWESAINLIRQHPIIGVGYNTLKSRRYEHALPGTTKLVSQFQDGVSRNTQLGNRADSGFDSSLLTLFATTGLAGFGWFLWWVWKIGVRNFSRKTISSRWYLVSTLGLFIASWFINAWLYPPILVLWLVAISLAEVE